jgi:hypothetical protein
VVVAQRNEHALADGDHVVDDLDAFFDLADTQDGHLRLADDRQADQSAEDAWVRDRERAALDVVGGELLVPGAVREIGDAAVDGGQRQLVARLMTGTIKPLSSATATPMLMSFL